MQTEKFARVCGRHARERGHNTAFGLVDEIFTRQFFTKVTWSGIVKKGNEPKEAFIQFKRIREWFFQLVQSIDVNYTEADMDVFFKDKVIANSGQRAKVQHKRASRVKCKGGAVMRSNVRDDDDVLNDHAKIANASTSTTTTVPTNVYDASTDSTAIEMQMNVSNLSVLPPPQLLDELSKPNPAASTDFTSIEMPTEENLSKSPPPQLLDETSKPNAAASTDSTSIEKLNDENLSKSPPSHTFDTPTETTAAKEEILSASDGSEHTESNQSDAENSDSPEMGMQVLSSLSALSQMAKITNLLVSKKKKKVVKHKLLTDDWKESDREMTDKEAHNLEKRRKKNKK